MNDHETLTKLGAGSLGIDVLREECTFNGAPISPLHMARELGAWFREDLAAHDIPADAITAASVAVDFRTEPLRGERRAPEVWARTDATTRYISCHLHCESRVATDEREYRSRLDDYEEWPESWWKRHGRSTA